MRILGRSPKLAGIVAAALIGATPLAAHPKLLATVPAANATVAGVTRLELRFNEPLVARFSGIELARAGAKVPGLTTRVGPDGRTLITTAPAPLPAGRYLLGWHAVATDTHRVAGRFAFAVR